MKLTREQAVAECKKLWGEIETARLSKVDFLSTKKGRKWKGKYSADCPLCEHAENCCLVCILVELYNENCYSLGFLSRKPCPEFWRVVERLK